MIELVYPVPGVDMAINVIRRADLLDPLQQVFAASERAVAERKRGPVRDEDLGVVRDLVPFVLQFCAPSRDLKGGVRAFAAFQRERRTEDLYLVAGVVGDRGDRVLKVGAVGKNSRRLLHSQRLEITVMVASHDELVRMREATQKTVKIFHLLGGRVIRVRLGDVSGMNQHVTIGNEDRIMLAVRVGDANESEAVRAGFGAFAVCCDRAVRGEK